MNQLKFNEVIRIFPFQLSEIYHLETQSKVEDRLGNPLNIKNYQFLNLSVSRTLLDKLYE